MIWTVLEAKDSGRGRTCPYSARAPYRENVLIRFFFGIEVRGTEIKRINEPRHCNKDMEDQTEFKILILDPEDIQQQSNAWETCKRSKASALDCHFPATSVQCGKLKECAAMENDDVKSDIEIIDTADNVKAPNDEQEHLDGEIEVITFFLGSAHLRNPSEPLPPPSRFVRTRK
jgi:hypothetical protein